MKKFVFSVVILILSVFFSPAFANCNVKPNYIPNDYTVVSCGRYSHVYLESYVVKDNKTDKFGAYTYWAEPDNGSSSIMNAGLKYNKMIADVIYDDVIPVKDGFIVKLNNKYGFVHVDKGTIYDVQYDKIYLSNDQKQVYAQSGSATTKKNNPDNLADNLDNAMFNVFIKPLFFWLEPVLPTR